MRVTISEQADAAAPGTSRERSAAEWPIWRRLRAIGLALIVPVSLLLLWEFMVRWTGTACKLVPH